MSDKDMILALDLAWIADNDVQKKSSPGVPYVKEGISNEKLFSSESSRGLVFSIVVQRIRRILSFTLEEIRAMSPVQLVQEGLVDPVKVFIKSEPHKRAKLDAGKLRIISNVSIVDQIIERLLFSKQNKKEIIQWRNCPSKPGMGLHDAGLQELYAEVTQAQAKAQLVETDVSGWDWSVPAWLLQFDADCRVMLYGAPPSSALAKLIQFRAHAISNKVFALSDGTLYQQCVPGVQASGSYNTSSTNSRMRVSLAWMVGASWAIAMGDDDVEDEVDGAADKYRAMGFTIKDYKLLPGLGQFEFCSTEFHGSWKGYSSQWLRTVFRFLAHSPASHKQNPEFRSQLDRDLRHHPNRQEILSKCDAVVASVSKLTDK